ncbi:MAG: ribonuclease P protein component [Anaerolineae bacterium]|nr:ribonuclease P protein component [Anaerolineae bacterium]MDW8071011.1 ribonuclease P protein component [Anaerolineae bacterium]
MKRKYRLRKRADFQRTRQKGKCWEHRLVVLCVLRNHLEYSRFGFAASRRIGKAAVRNRARRRMREIVRLNMAAIEPGWDVVFIARPALLEATYSELTDAICALLQRAGLWVKETRPLPAE